MRVVQTGAVVLLLAGAGSVHGQDAGRPPESPAPASAAANASTAEARREKAPSADEILTALETADRGLRVLRAEILYDKTFEMQGDRQIRQGVLYFVGGVPGAESGAAGSGGRKFAVHFTRLIVGDVEREQEQFLVFDGRYLVEKLPETREFIKREVVPPGQSFDPLKIGEGPFPLPIGQKKSDILERYEVSALAPEDGLGAAEDANPAEKADAERLVAFVSRSGAVQLVLKPRDGEDDSFTQIRLWYVPDSAGRYLPRMSRTVDRAGDVATVQLINPEAAREGEEGGPAIPAEVLDTATPPDGWKVRVIPWRGRADDE